MFFLSSIVVVLKTIDPKKHLRGISQEFIGMHRNITGLLNHVAICDLNPYITFEFKRV